jgi:hypothetical protein
MKLRGAPPEPRPPAPLRVDGVDPKCIESCRPDSPCRQAKQREDVPPNTFGFGGLLVDLAYCLHRLVLRVRARLASLVPLVTRRKVLAAATACAAVWEADALRLTQNVDYWRRRFETEQSHAQILREQRDARIEECEDLRKKLRARRKKAKR